MTHEPDDIFLQQLNRHLGIAHKVCNAYFAASEDRQDLLQEMMYQLWRSYPHFQQQSSFSTWMYRVCLNTAITYLRRSGKKKTEMLHPDHHQIPDHGQAERDERMEQLFEAIRVLSPVNRAIILLYLEDLPYEEIAAVTGLSKSNVSVRLVRIRRELEERLREKNNTKDDVQSR